MSKRHQRNRNVDDKVAVLKSENDDGIVAPSEDACVPKLVKNILQSKKRQNKIVKCETVEEDVNSLLSNSQSTTVCKDESAKAEPVETEKGRKRSKRSKLEVNVNSLKQTVGFGSLDDCVDKETLQNTFDSISSVDNWLSLAEIAIGSACAKKALISSKFVGAHVSISGGLDKVPLAAAISGCLAFGLFLRNQRRWEGPPLDPKIAENFKKNCLKYNFSAKHIVPHGSYLLNAGSPNRETLLKTRDALLDEVKRCEMLGLTLYNFHPGSTCGKISIEECVTLVAESINLVHEQTKDVVLVLETMAGQGSTIGGFDELKSVIDLVNDKSRVGVCIDSCHVFAAGYDVSEKVGYENMMNEFESKIGIDYLKAVHLNDSMGKCGCHLDRHENIGRGKIGLDGFTNFMNDPRLNDVPLILETPISLSDSEEIVLLYDLLDSSCLSAK